MIKIPSDKIVDEHIKLSIERHNVRPDFFVKNPNYSDLYPYIAKFLSNYDCHKRFQENYKLYDEQSTTLQEAINCTVLMLLIECIYENPEKAFCEGILSMAPQNDSSMYY